MIQNSAVQSPVENLPFEPALEAGPASVDGELTVIVPVYNEVETFAQVLGRVIQEPTPKEIVVVDDGSSDGTSERLDEWQKTKRRDGLPNHVRRVVVVRHPVNLGKGAAIRTGLDLAQGDYVVVQDADLEVSPEEYPRLLQPVRENAADLVIGYRTRIAGSHRALHGAGIRLLNLLVRILYGESILDEACCFKLLRRRDLLRMQLQCHRFEFCPEVVAKGARLGLRFAQVPVSYNPRDCQGGKKLRLRDGLQAVWTLFKYRFWRAG